MADGERHPEKRAGLGTHQAALSPTAVLPNHSCAVETDSQDGGAAGDENDDQNKRTPTSFPETSIDAPKLPDAANSEIRTNGEEVDRPNEYTSSRLTSPAPTARGKNVKVHEKADNEGICRIHRFWLYETAKRFYVVGGDVLERKFRLLKIDRSADNIELSIAEDNIIYTKKDMNQVLDTLDDGNKASGGMKLKFSFGGLLGFVRFTGAYYMLLVTKKSPAAVVGGHYIYHIDETELISLAASTYRSKVDKDPEEARFIGILNNLDLTRSFYFSYSYDVTRTLQRNMLRERSALQNNQAELPARDHNSMFVWNHHFLRPASAVLKSVYDWCLPIVHGFVDQSKISVYGQIVYVTMIARRSRFYAGARYLKRGANDLGYVANDVETEQIVSRMLTTSLHAPGFESFVNPNYTSYVQHRVNLIDPFYSAAALHFDDLFERYGTPIFVLNLIKSRERTPRESILLSEYSNAITYLNQFLPNDQKIRYKAWDMSRASKSPDQDVIGTLETIAEDVVTLTGIFRNGTSDSGDLRIQKGIARTNCIDCLDRTNAAQFVIGKRALSHQLHALGVIDDTSIDYDTDAINLFTNMFHNHGDTIAVQYGGSHLVNTVATYRKINQWSNQRKDMIESFRRYYNNSFLDKQRQEAYNLFLGNYIFAQGQPMLWDLSTDYYLHHVDPRAWFAQKRRSYKKWFTPEHLLSPQTPVSNRPHDASVGKPLSFFDEWWIEYYRPHQLSQYGKLLPLKIKSTNDDESGKGGNDGRSPFKVKDGHGEISPGKQQWRDTIRYSISTLSATDSLPSTTSQLAHNEQSPALHSILESLPLEAKEIFSTTGKRKEPPKNKSTIAQWTLDQFVTNSLNPSMAATEAHEYQRYVNHPSNLPLVVSNEVPPNANMALLSYVNSVSIDVVTNMHSMEDDLADYKEFLDVGEEPLTVTEADAGKKRYKAYRQWVKGKSLFKQRVEA